MSKIILFTLFAVALLTGCGGGGGSSSSVFAGHYTGEYASTATDNDDHGSVNLIVSNDGSITGTVADSRSSDPGIVLTGSTIRRDGTVTLNVGFGDGPMITRSWSGKVEAAGDTLAGTLAETRGDLTEPFDYVLTRSP